MGLAVDGGAVDWGPYNEP